MLPGRSYCRNAALDERSACENGGEVYANVGTTITQLGKGIVRLLLGLNDLAFTRKALITAFCRF